jgi:hypothetical protein
MTASSRRPRLAGHEPQVRAMVADDWLLAEIARHFAVEQGAVASYCRRHVIHAPTSPTSTPRSDSAMQKRMRATAAWWLARSQSWLAGMVLRNGVWVKPKWATQGARLLMAAPAPP